jgi:hypothetical protein
MIRSSGMFAKNSSGIHYHMLEYRNKDVRDQPALRVTEDYDLYPTTLLLTYQRATLWTCSTIRVSSSCVVPQKQSWPDRKDPVYSYFFLLPGEKFIGNSSPCASMKRREEKGQKWFPWMKPYIIRYLLGIGAAAVVVVTLCVGERTYAKRYCESVGLYRC